MKLSHNSSATEVWVKHHRKMQARFWNFYVSDVFLLQERTSVGLPLWFLGVCSFGGFLFGLCFFGVCVFVTINSLKNAGTSPL